jgi:hypothetical protein
MVVMIPPDDDNITTALTALVNPSSSCRHATWESRPPLSATGAHEEEDEDSYSWFVVVVVVVAWANISSIILAARSIST